MNTSNTDFLLFVGGWFVSALFSAALASDKGKGAANTIGAFFLGLIFGPVMLLYMIGSPDEKSRGYLKRIADKLDPPVEGKKAAEEKSGTKYFWQYTN